MSKIPRNKSWLLYSVDLLISGCDDAAEDWPNRVEFYKAKKKAYEYTKGLIEQLEDETTIEPPVVRGEWICNPDESKFSLVCSACGQVMPFVPEYLPAMPPFCNCGAKMDAKEDTTNE
jgi:hypothetical protein